jgi:hypothetical protein
MTKAQLKNKILEKIKKLENPELLEEIYRLLESETSDVEVYKLTPEQQKSIEEGLDDYKKGEIISDKDVNEKMDENYINITSIQKTKLVETINNLPEEFSLDELIDRIILVQKVEEAQQQSKNGFKYTEEEARRKIKKWSK